MKLYPYINEITYNPLVLCKKVFDDNLIGWWPFDLQNVSINSCLDCTGSTNNKDIFLDVVNNVNMTGPFIYIDCCTGLTTTPRFSFTDSNTACKFGPLPNSTTRTTRTYGYEEIEYYLTGRTLTYWVFMENSTNHNLKVEWGTNNQGFMWIDQLQIVFGLKSTGTSNYSYTLSCSSGWTFISMVVDGYNLPVKIYTGSTTNEPSLVSTGINGTYVNSYLKISNSGTNKYFTIHDLVLHDKGLTLDELKLLYYDTK